MSKTKRGIRVRKDAEAWKTCGWTSVPNRILDSGAELGEGGVAAFCWMARHREDFEFTAEDVAAAFGVGLHKAEDWLYALEFNGWLTRQYERDHRGWITGIEYTLHPAPVGEDDRTAKPRKPRKKRSNFAKPGGNPRSDRKSDRTEVREPESGQEPETSRSDRESGRQESGRPESRRPEYGRTERNKEEKTIKEDQHHHEQPPAAPEAPASNDDGDVEAFWKNLGATVQVDPAGRRTVAAEVRTALAATWTPDGLSEWVQGRIRAANGSVRNRAGFAVSQLRDIPAPPQPAAPSRPSPRALIDACDRCDEGGWVEHGDGVKKCKHEAVHTV